MLSKVFRVARICPPSRTLRDIAAVAFCACRFPMASFHIHEINIVYMMHFCLCKTYAFQAYHCFKSRCNSRDQPSTLLSSFTKDISAFMRRIAGSRLRQLRFAQAMKIIQNHVPDLGSAWPMQGLQPACRIGASALDLSSTYSAFGSFVGPFASLQRYRHNWCCKGLFKFWLINQ